MSESSSDFIVPADFSAEWQDVTLIQKRARTHVYVGARYGRRFVLKALAPEYAELTDYRLQQEHEFQLGVQLVHPNIAATYNLEPVEGVGRCIVQEWIDGVTLGEWLQTQPSRAAIERVLEQLLDGLEYVHSLQLVHHDLKSDNILITRNGANVKLIDFGLSATDATISPVENDPRVDIEAVQKLFPKLCPKGEFENIAALRKVIQHRKRIWRVLPVVLSVVLLVVAAALFYLSWHERYVAQQRYDAMLAQVDTYIAQEEEEYIELANRPVSFDSKSSVDMVAFMNYIDEHGVMRERYRAIRDSLMSAYEENDPLREQLFHLWSIKEMELDKEYYPQLYAKMR